MSEAGPAETFYYFAYGSNMLTRRLRADNRAPSARPIGVSYTCGRRLTFDKVGKDGSGKCDAERTPEESDRLFGVVFQIAAQDLLHLDRVEGTGHGYVREAVSVFTSSGSFEALTYVAIRKSADVRPFAWYKALVLEGAREHGLPQAHVEKIRAVESVIDPDERRRSANRRLIAVG